MISKIVVVVLVLFFPSMAIYAEELSKKESLDFILTACGGDNSSEEKQSVSSNIAKLLELDAGGEYEKTSEKQGLSMIFSGFKDEEKKAEAMKFFPQCIQQMMTSMKGFLSEEQKKVLSDVIKATEMKPANSYKEIKLFEPTECQRISELENVQIALISDGSTYCDEKNRFALKFTISRNSDALKAKSSNLMEIHNYHTVNSFGIRKIEFPSGKIRYFQLPFAVKEDKVGNRVVQMNFVPKPE